MANTNQIGCIRRVKSFRINVRRRKLLYSSIPSRIVARVEKQGFAPKAQIRGGAISEVILRTNFTIFS